MKKIKIFKDKDGNKLSFKEFMIRWKSGIETINPLQKIKVQIGGTRIMLIGLFLGLCVSIYGWKNLWWVGIILIGALLNTGVQYLGLIQQRKLLDNIEKQFNELEEDDKDIEISLDGKEKSGMSEMGFKIGKDIDKNIEEDNSPQTKPNNIGNPSKRINEIGVGCKSRDKTEDVSNIDKEKEVKTNG